MDRDKLKDLLTLLAQGQLAPNDAYEQLKNLSFVDLGFAKIDNHRALRQGLPEVIFCPGKTSEQIIKIAQELKTKHEVVVATRCEPTAAHEILSALKGASYFEQARMIVYGTPKEPGLPSPYIAVVAAGTADLPVAEEAALFLESTSIRTKRLYDVGVAGIHRLLANMDILHEAAVIIVVAGMDGALPSVVGGLVECPVIAVPTSIGYGTSFHGIAPLLTMLNSCAAGVTVVNIDNGFGAATAAIRILSQIHPTKPIKNEGSEAATNYHDNVRQTVTI